MFSKLRELADQVQDGAAKLAEEAKRGLDQVSTQASEAYGNLDASIKAATVNSTPNVKPENGAKVEGGEMDMGQTDAGAPSVAGSEWGSRPGSPTQRSKPTSPAKNEAARMSMDKGDRPGVPPKHDPKAASIGDLQMENMTLRDQLHETLSQLAALQKTHEETDTKFKETSSQLDLVKQKARTRLTQLTKEVEELRKKNAEHALSPAQASPAAAEPSTPDSALPSKIAELEATVAKLTSNLDAERKKAEEAEEQLLSATAEFEQRLLSERKEAEEERERANERVNKLEAEISTLQSSLKDDVASALESSERKLVDLERENGDLKSRLDEAGESTDKIGELEARIETVARESREREATFEERFLEETERASNLEAEAGDLRRRLAETESRSRENEDVISAPADTEELNELREKVGKAELDLSEAKATIAELESRPQQATVASEARESLEEKEALAEELSAVKLERDELRRTLDARGAELDSLEARLAEVSENADGSPSGAEELEALRSERDHFERTLRMKAAQVEELEALLAEASGARDQAESHASEQFNEARSELETALKKVQELEGEVEEKDRIATERRHLLQAMEDDLAEAQQSLTKKDEELASNREPVESLEVLRAELEDSKRIVSELEAELAAAKDRQAEQFAEGAEKAQPPPPYDGPNPEAMAQEIMDLKQLVEELRHQPTPTTPSMPGTEAGSDSDAVMRAKEAAWAEEKRILEEEAARQLEARTKELQRRISELEKLVEEAKGGAVVDGVSPVSGATPAVSGENVARLKELETRNFTLEEQARDFSLQIKTRTETVSKQQEQLTALKSELDKAKAEHEEKFKKMRSILGQANKSIAETREKLAATEKEKERLIMEVDNKDESNRQIEAERNSLRAEIDRLERELSDERELRDNMAGDFESKNRQLQSDLTMARSEYQKYKVKAAMALQQQSSAALEGRITELEEAKTKLEKERTQHRNELDAALAQAANAEAELASSLDRIEFLEGRIRSLENLGKDAGVARQEFESLKQTIELEKNRANEAIRARDGEWEGKLASERREMEGKLVDAQAAVRQKEEETGSLRSICEALSAQLSAARDEVGALKKELDETKRSAAAWAVAAAGHQRSEEGGLFSAASPGPTSPFGGPLSTRDFGAQQSIPSSTVRGRTAHGSSLQDLLSRRDSIDSVSSSNPGTHSSSRGDRESAAKLAHMAELLNESEAQVTRLMEQEKVLKEEIRSMDRSGKRANLNIEYLKNVVLKFLENPSERQQLTLVLTNILQLTPSETNRLKGSLTDDPLGVTSATTSIGTALGLW